MVGARGRRLVSEPHATGSPSGSAPQAGAIRGTLGGATDVHLSEGFAVNDERTALVGLWDRIVALAERIGSDEWERPTPCPATDIGTLVAHVAGTSAVATRRGAAGGAIDALRAARDAQVTQLLAVDEPAEAEAARAQRVIAAGCLDLWVHAYDLATALGEPVDLDEDSPAVRAAARYVLDFAPHLLARRVRAEDGATLRIGVRGAAPSDRTAAVRESRGQWMPEARGAGASVIGKPTALMLLVSGRGDPEQWRAAGALDWSGAGGEAFVRGARLLA